MSIGVGRPWCKSSDPPSTLLPLETDRERGGEILFPLPRREVAYWSVGDFARPASLDGVGLRAITGLFLPDRPPLEALGLVGSSDPTRARSPLVRRILPGATGRLWRRDETGGFSNVLGALPPAEEGALCPKASRGEERWRKEREEELRWPMPEGGRPSREEVELPSSEGVEDEEERVGVEGASSRLARAGWLMVLGK